MDGSKTKNQKIYLIGTGMGQENTLTKEAAQIIENSGCLIGAARMVEPYLNSGKEIVVSYLPEEIKAYLDAQEEPQVVSVLLSGDSGFYSGAKKLIQVLSEYEILVLPGISSIVYLAAKIQMSWEDAALISMHGTSQNFIHTVMYEKKTYVLFGGRKQAEEVYEKLKEYKIEDLLFYIGKNLGGPKESIEIKCASMIVPEDLEGLCTVCVVNDHPLTRKGNLQDAEFIRGEVPMTKEEIRFVSVGKMKLSEDAVVYDIGAGTGSVAVEMALRIPKGRVYAVEKNPEGVRLIHENRRKFYADNLIVTEGTAPEVLEYLPAPTHVFIGGSSGNLREIIRSVREKNPAVRIVMNLITLENLSTVCEMAKDGLLCEEKLEITQIAASRSRKLGAYHLMTGLNPIYIITC